LKLTTDSTEVYTFKVERAITIDSQFENFVIEKENDSVFNYLIYKYELDNSKLESEFPYKVFKEELTNEQINIEDFQGFINKQNDQETSCYIVGNTASPRDFSYTYFLIEVSCGGSLNGGTTSGTSNPSGSSNTTNTTSGNPNFGSGGGSPTGILPVGMTVTKLKIFIKNCLTTVNSQVIDNINDTSFLVTLNTYLQDNLCSNEAEQFAQQAIGAFMNNECVILPVLNPESLTQEEIDEIDSVSGYVEQIPQEELDHVAIEAAYDALIAAGNKTDAVQYLIDSYDMENFGSVNVAGTYTYSINNSISPIAVTTATLASGVYTFSVVINEGVLNHPDFAFTTRAIKHELYHMFQHKFLTPLSHEAREFDAYIKSLFRFTKLPVATKLTQKVFAFELMKQYNLLTDQSEKDTRTNNYNLTKENFPRINCP